MKFHLAAAGAALAWCATAMPARAQNPDPTDIRGCTAIESDAQRLICYDHATGRVNLPAAQKREVQAPAGVDMFGHDAHGASTTRNNNVATPLSLLDSRWELSPESKLAPSISVATSRSTCCRCSPAATRTTVRTVPTPTIP